MSPATVNDTEDFRPPSLSVVGIGVRLPGARDKKEYFELLKEGRCAIGQVPADRWNAKAMTQLGGVPGKVVTDQGGFVDPHTEIDSLEFGISPAESKMLDPHQLMLVEVVFQALEDSGINYRGTNTGVYVTGSPDVHNVGKDMYNMGPYSATGAAFSMQANRLSYLFDLRGPSVYLDTACSSSITCLHLARTAILRGDCDMAVVAAVNLILTPDASLSFSTLGTLSATGICHTFDASADGYVRGEGCTVIVLQRTEEAKRLGSHIYTEVTGSAINANGKGKSITLPDGPQQKAATYAAYREANRKPCEAAYVECHGTGTPVGDPIEANAVGQVFTPGRAENDLLRIGSAKTNVGHLEPAAGLVGLIKACYTLDTGLMLPHLFFKDPSPRIHWDEYKIKVQTEVEPLPESKLSKDGKFIVSLSSFGFGGANSHTVMEREPNVSLRETITPLSFRDPMLVAVGALSNRAVTSLSTSVQESWADLQDPLQASFLARTMTERARGHPNMTFAVGSLDEPLTFGETTATSSPDFNPIKAFVFCGQGPQHENMGRHLYARFAAFRNSVNTSFAIVEKFHSRKFQDNGMFDSERDAQVESWTVELIVISITIFQIALFDLWVSLGVVPDVVMGHSVGEIAAMYASGAFTHEKAIRTAIARSNALALLDSIDGSMAALGVSREEGARLIDEVMREHNTTTGLWVSASNSTSAVSVSGATHLIEELVKRCEASGIFARQLRVGGPYHSPMVMPCKEPFLSEVYPLVDAEKNVPTRRFISTVEGRMLEKGTSLTAEYCWDNVSCPVLFRESIEALNAYRKEKDRGLLIVEIAPHAVLGSYMDEICRATGAERTSIVSSARRPNFKKGETKDTPSEVSQFLTAVGSAMQAGERGIIVYKLYNDQFVDRPMGINAIVEKLPEYPFQPLKNPPHETTFPEHIRQRDAGPPLCSALFRINAQTHSWTKGHKIRGTIVFPGAGYAEAALEAGARTITNMHINRAFVIEEDTSPKYAQFITTGINNGWEFRSSGKNAVNDAGIIFDQLHAHGQMSPEYTPIGPNSITEVFGEDWLSHFDIIMDGQTFYDRLKPNGSQHTAAFGMINQVRGSTTREDDYLAFVDVLPDLWDGPEADGMVFHPGLLDSAFLCTWIPALPFDGTKLGVDAFLPNLLDILALRASPEEIRAAKQIVLYVQTLISNDQNIKHNILMFDRNTGKTLAFLRGLECTRIKDTAKEREAYTESWEPRCFESTTPLADAFSLEAPLAAQFAADMAQQDESGVVAEATRRGNAAAVCADDLQDALFDLPGVSEEVALSFVAMAEHLITSSREQTPRRVYRVLELYGRRRKISMQPLVAWAQKRGIYIDLVRLNVASALKGTPEFFTGPYDVPDAIDAFKRTIPATFDLAFVTDSLRTSVDAMATVAAVDALLIPGGYAFYVEANSGGPLARLLFRTPSPNPSSLGLQALADTPSLQLFSTRRDNAAWPNLGVIPTKSVLDSGHFRRAGDALVYYHKPDTEYLVVPAIREAYGDSPRGNLWILADDTTDGARAIGLAGTITNELVTLRAMFVGFDPTYTRAQRDGLLDLFIERDAEGSMEVFTLVRNGRLYGRRLVKQTTIHPTEMQGRDWVLELVEGQPASVQAIAPHLHTPVPVAEHDVQVQSDAVALNFKNILSATGLLPATDRLSEFAGVVREVGSGVTRFKVGDRVMGTSGGVREGTVATASEYSLAKVPSNMSNLEAAAYPIAYGTVWYGLVHLAQIRAGEKVLIHAAAGGVGLCAIQIAQRKGLEVFCTVSSQEKRDYLHKHLGVPYENMANSRVIAEWLQSGRDWLAKRGRTGFDVVLNSLQGAALQAGIDSLDYLGRFVDISKRDHLAGNPMSMSGFAKAINYIAVELGLLGNYAPQRLASLFDEIAAEHAREPFKCLVGHEFKGANGLVASYKLMESGKHIGKVVTDLSEEVLPGAKTVLWNGYKVYDPRKSYVLIGGCGGLGPRLAQFLMYLGARNIVLTGRRGLISRSDRLALERLVRDPAFPDVTIKVMAADALNPQAMRDVFDTAETLAPIGGVFLMSVVLRDDQFLNMDKEKFDTVMQSKIGALNVVQSQLDITKLDFFFLFSSTAALFFNPGQANYNAAQTYFNRFAQERHNVISYAVPAISDIGVYAQMRSKNTNNAALKVMDALACNSRELCTSIAQSIGRLIMGGDNHAGYFIQPMDWKVMYEISPANIWSISHLVEHLDDAEGDVGDDETAADPVGVLLGKLLNVDIDTVDDTMFLSTLGLDSLSASKLSAILMSEFGVTVTQLQLLGPVSVAALRQIVEDARDESDAPAKADAPANKGRPAPVAHKVETEPIVAFNYAAEVDKLDDLPRSVDGLVPFTSSTLAPQSKQTVFVTGATGFLGSSALEGVLNALPNARVIALVRHSAPGGMDRIRDVAAKRELSTLQHLDRVSAVVGDVTKPRLGLAVADWDALARSVDLIVHASGRADHLIGYQGIADINVLSTREVLRLAADQKVKAVANIGSTNMWLTFTNKPREDELVREDLDIRTLSNSLWNGYSQSKWVSEMLCRRMHERGVPAITIRPGVLGGSATSRYIPNPDSFLYRMLSGFVQMGMAPKTHSRFTETSSDWFAEIFGKLVATPRTWDSGHDVFHIRNEKTLESSDFPRPKDTHPLKEVPYEEWVDAFQREAAKPESTNPLVPLSAFVVKGELAQLPRFDHSNTKEVLGDQWTEAPPYRFEM
ncbi:Type I Iterative PKS [Malassezia vespertilionis]|uniref:Type I Iterative Polyketide synthase (PKS) n=1 Tax=Malassezia vespertilionis TaxID=2020962 RepID=A0A2N1J8Z2_9BASI|nr:Type I Iterative PKS [Malassezia vespertilionis]PKI83018.1 Type I Iterative Polyketide synthase (PKS) [Malassezia vespertilionis]WFD07780.1 Type I Iterative PKS [Malassezia vespertilionis]